MKKTLFVLPVLVLGLSACDAPQDTVHLSCKYVESADVPQTEKLYDVVVHFLDDGAVISVDGNEYKLAQQYDAPVVFYRFDPWYNLQIGNRDFSAKYTLGIPVDGPAVYIPCEEVSE